MSFNYRSGHRYLRVCNSKVLQAIQSQPPKSGRYFSIDTLRLKPKIYVSADAVRSIFSDRSLITTLGSFPFQCLSLDLKSISILLLVDEMVGVHGLVASLNESQCTV